MLRERKSGIPRRTALAALLIAATFAPVCDHRAEAGSERHALIPGSWEAEEALLFDPFDLTILTFNDFLGAPKAPPPAPPMRSVSAGIPDRGDGGQPWVRIPYRPVVRTPYTPH